MFPTFSFTGMNVCVTHLLFDANTLFSSFLWLQSSYGFHLFLLYNIALVIAVSASNTLEDARLVGYEYRER